MCERKLSISMAKQVREMWLSLIMLRALAVPNLP